MELAAALKALADENRLLILKLLGRRDYCVRALARQLGVSQAAVSQHLKVLREAGLISGEKRGYFIHYRVDGGALRAVSAALAGLARPIPAPCGGCGPGDRSGCPSGAPALAHHWEVLPMRIAVTYENGQARERTQVLMDLANQTGGMVIGTGDMSELALGWATYNGDHMSMYGVNAGVPKTLVRHLVQYYADTCGQEELRKVLLDVLDTPVSPELLPPIDGVISQKTEDLVGPYELHDFYLYYMLRCGFEPEKIYRLALYAFQGIYDKETIFKWLKTFYRRFFTQQFKRSCLPDGPKVGSVAVSPRGDLRMPSDASAAAWMSAIEAMEEKDSADTFAC